MKILIGLFFLTVLLSCGTQKVTVYKYNVIARGYKKTVTVNQKTIKIKEGSAETVLIETSPEFWTALQKGSDKIELNKIATLESPTNKRQIDAAMFAKVEFVTKDSTYKSAGFDHGHPPEILKTVVDSLLNITLK